MQIDRFVYPSPSFRPYWENGRGSVLLSHLNKLPGPSDLEKRISSYFHTDELGDAVIAETYAKLPFEQAAMLFKQAFTDSFPSGEYPISSQLLTELCELPTWFDRKLFNHGIQLCQRSGSLGLMVLRNYCLMGGYESAAINKPLIYTGALKKGAAKRLRETTEFWLQVVGPDALDKRLLHQYALQTRLMHAYSRHMILQHTEWSVEKWGEPLNEWDMIATNLGFSMVYLDGLRALGFQPAPEEVLGLFHFWKYMGYLLGIPPEMLPETEEEAIQSLYLWTMNQPSADEDTVALARALMQEPIESPFPKYRWQKWFVKKIHLGYNAYFLGKTSCTNLGLPYSRFRWVIHLQKLQQTYREKRAHRSPEAYQQMVIGNRKIQEKIVALFFEIKAEEQ